MVCQINHWNDRQCRRELKAAMTGNANRLTQDIDVEDVDAVNTIEMCLTAYQDGFQPAAARQVARVECYVAAQLNHKTAHQFHGRCTEMFARAYPGQAPNESVLSIQNFALRLADTEICRFVLDQNPFDYAAASNLAQVKSATKAALQVRRKGTSG
jgi:hypothetical protein